MSQPVSQSDSRARAEELNALSSSSVRLSQLMLPSSILPAVALGWYCILWTIGLIGCFAARRHFRRRSHSTPLDLSNAPGVTIIRPLKGLDTNLYENLESTFKQIYPKFQVLLSVADADDQALDVVRKLLENYPDVDAQIVISNEEIGINPKVNNLVRPYKLAKYDVLWVLDSNVLVGPNTLKNAVLALLSNSKRRVGLVHQVPFAKTFTGAEHALGSRIEEAFLNTNHAKMYIAINTVAIESCIVGKSNMFRRSDVDRLDGSLKPIDGRSPDKTRKTGLEAFAKLLAEDNAIGSSLWHELDLRHELSNDVAGNVVGHMSFSAYVWRRVRWIRVRKHMVLAATLAEPFTECFVVSALGIWAVRRLFSVPVWITFLMHYAAWIWVDLDVYESLAGHKLPVSRWKSFFSAWFLREALALPIWVLAMFGSEVEWRGERYRVGFNGEALRVA